MLDELVLYLLAFLLLFSGTLIGFLASNLTQGLLECVVVLVPTP